MTGQCSTRLGFTFDTIDVIEHIRADVSACVDTRDVLGSKLRSLAIGSFHAERREGASLACRRFDLCVAVRLCLFFAGG